MSTKQTKGDPKNKPNKRKATQKNQPNKHKVIHTATHLGHHPLFGAPTGKALTWYGVPNSFVKNINGNWK